MLHIRQCMDKIYVVTIGFEDWESSSWNTVGYFTDIKKAEETKKKWEDFFEFQEKEIFNLQRDLNGNFESDEIEDEWYSRVSKYEQIHSYTGVTMEEFPFNTDVFVNQKENRSKEMQNLVVQWERDYKINKITDKQ
jgi:hypothetical protein